MPDSGDELMGIAGNATPQCARCRDASVSIEDVSQRGLLSTLPLDDATPEPSGKRGNSGDGDQPKHPFGNYDASSEKLRFGSDVPLIVGQAPAMHKLCAMWVADVYEREDGTFFAAGGAPVSTAIATMCSR